MGLVETVRKLDEIEWLDKTSDPLQSAIRKLFDFPGGGELKKFLHGTFLGHPLHPALIDVPLGAWTVAAILDGLELAAGKQRGGAADSAIGIGLIGALAAAVSGATDWSETDGRAKKIGLVHGLLNVGATSLYALSLLNRNRSRTKAIGLSLMGYGVAMTAAYLGGHLVYGEQIGVDHTATAEQGKPEKFTTVLPERELRENTPVKVVADGVAVVLVRQGDAIYALRETCTHLGGPLSEGKIEGDGIRCPWHGSRFCLKDGRVLDGPAVFPERRFEVRVREGNVQVRAARD
jgi:nitrite reductase/ring-hydroxylating ferredoxin subunit/uncharacterized membrane protein